MRRYIDIIVDAKDGIIPTHEERYLALLALSAHNHFVEGHMNSLEENKNKPDHVRLFGLNLRTKNFRKNCMNFRKLSPRKYLGEMGNPFNKNAFKDACQEIISNFTKNT